METGNGMSREEELEMMERLDLGEDYLDVATDLASRRWQAKMESIAKAPDTDNAIDRLKDEPHTDLDAEARGRELDPRANDPRRNL